MTAHSLAIYYATETGNAEALAHRAHTCALNHGWAARLQNLATVDPAELASVTLALFVVSTWGDGEPPTDATRFSSDLAQTSLNLAGLRYAVFGLGDRGYPEFNAFARQLDQRLASLGAIVLAPRAEADVDYEDLYTEWESRLFARLAGLRAELQSA